MRHAKRWRYYCDFCKRAGGSRGHMEKHERGCTNNPQRVCGLCHFLGVEQPALAGLIGIWESQGFAALQAATNECPACTLAAMRQSKSDNIRFLSGAQWAKAWDWSFKNALADFWAQVNAERAE